MTRYAIVHRATNEVVNITEWDGKSAWAPSPDCDAIQSDIAEIGGTWTGSVFVPPVPPVDPRAADYERCRDYVVSAEAGDTADRLNTYLVTASPTAAETVLVVKETVRTLRALIRIVRQIAST